MVQRASIKEKAKTTLKGNWGVSVGAIIIGALITGAAGLLAGIGTFIITGVIQVGLAYLFIGIFRGQKAKFEDMFKGFSNFGTTCVAGMLVQIFTFLWSLLFVIPGIIKSLSYAMTPYILSDNPEMSGLDAISASRKMMNGHKWDLFVLYLSFLGWNILSAFTFGLLTLLYVAPYTAISVAGFYDEIKDENSQEGYTAQAQ